MEAAIHRYSPSVRTWLLVCHRQENMAHEDTTPPNQKRKTVQAKGGSSKLDLRKACDSACWVKILSIRGFSQRWCIWISEPLSPPERVTDVHMSPLPYPSRLNLVNASQEAFMHAPTNQHSRVAVVVVERMNRSKNPSTKSCRHICTMRNPNLTSPRS